jgi:hypothetical protein
MQNKNPTHGQPAHPQTVVGLHPQVKHPQNLACKYVMIINPEMLEPIAQCYRAVQRKIANQGHFQPLVLPQIPAAAQ